MTQKQEKMISRLMLYLKETGLELLEEKPISYGQQYKISNGKEVCSVNIYTSGNILVGGKPSVLRQQLEEWKNFTLAQSGQGTSAPDDTQASQNRATKFVVAQAKFDSVKALLEELSGEIIWREGDGGSSWLYQAEIRDQGEKVVITQYSTGTLMVQGRASPLFDRVCDQFDKKLSQSIADRATRYIPEETRQAALEEMNRPEAEHKALDWLLEQIGTNTYEFAEPHDREILLSGASLLQAVKTAQLALPDYSVLVMPFARAYEGYLIKLFMHLGFADRDEIDKDLRKINVSGWIEELGDRIVDKRRHGHIVHDLNTAWTGSRHLVMHSDPVRQTKIPTYEQALNEIGVLTRAFRRGFESFVGQPIELTPHKKDHSGKRRTRSRAVGKPDSQKEKQQIKVERIDEAALLQRLTEAGYEIEHYVKPENATKWRVITDHWKVFCPRKPGDTLIVRGAGREEFLTWYSRETTVHSQVTSSKPLELAPHIGVDEAGKGDYFGPLTVGAVYVDSEIANELIRHGVRDSKQISDNVIFELAKLIQSLCPNVILVLPPSEYNSRYRECQNLNKLLADLHVEAIKSLVQQTGCIKVVDDQFAAARVLEDALARHSLSIDLDQRTGGEADIAVAAASILARRHFISAIQELRARANMEIPLGSSSPRVVQVGKAIVRRWGPAALGRAAKLNFRITEQVLGRGK